MRKPLRQLSGIVLLLLLPWSAHCQAGGVCGGNLGENIFPLGDFGSGTPNIGYFNPNLGFGFGRYQYASRSDIPPRPGFFTLTNDMGAWKDRPEYWMPIGDNSDDPEGYMMVLDAEQEPGVFFEADLTGLCGNTTYHFSIDAINVMYKWCCGLPGKKIPLLTVLLDGEEFLTRGLVHQLETWYTFEFTFTTPPGTSQMKLELRNDNTGGVGNNGNDLAIDNITVRSCGPAHFVNTEPDIFLCTTDFEPIPIIAGADSSYLLRWQVSRDGGKSWEDLPEETGRVLYHSDFTAGVYLYRYLSARSPEAMGRPTCRTLSDTVRVEVQPLTYERNDTICRGADYFLGDRLLTESGTYQASFKSRLGGCDSLVTVNLTVTEDRFEASFSSESPGCLGDTAGLIEVVPNAGFSPPLHYRVNGDTFTGPVLENLAEGEYRVEVEDRHRCREEDTIFLTVQDTFFVDAGPDITLDFGEISNLRRINANRDIGQVRWEPNDPFLAPDSLFYRVKGVGSRSYYLLAESVSGCLARDTLRIFLADDRVRIYIPDAFSPNGDGRNDRFLPYPFEETVQRIVSSRVYDRWGNLLFEQLDLAPTDFELGWDGTSRGIEMPPGKYIYRMEFTLIDGATLQRSGAVTLVR